MNHSDSSLTQDNQNILNDYQNILRHYQELENETNYTSNQNWLIIFSGVFSFFVLLFILSLIIRND